MKLVGILAFAPLLAAGCAAHKEEPPWAIQRNPGQSLDIVCQGKSWEFLYPGPEITGDATFEIIFLADGQVRLPGGGKLCRSEKAKCDVSDSAEHFHFSMANIPGRPGYSESTDLDFVSGKLFHGGGGIDGGWSFSGICKPSGRGVP